MAFHRTYVVYVPGAAGKEGSVAIGDEALPLPRGEAGTDVLAGLDAGMDIIRKKLGRRIICTFLHIQDEHSGDRWYAVVTSPTL